MKHIKLITYISVIVAILGFGAYSLYETYFYTPKYRAPAEQFVTKISTNPDLDSDGDGLRDWEEVLWKTDPFSVDTDGDGTNDGDEVAAQRDPTIKGPADILDKGHTENSTNKISEAIIDSYLKTDGKTTLDSKDVVNEILKNTYIATKSVTYTKEDLKKTTNSLSDIKEYGNSVARAFSAIQPTSQNELTVFAYALRTNDEYSIRNLDPIIKNYKEILSGLLLVKTPSELSAKHLELVNSMNKVIGDIEGMRLLFSDTTIAVSAISNYQTDLTSFEKNLRAIASTISSKGIEYSTDESGYGLLNIL